MKFIFAALMLLGFMPVAAQQVFKCVDTKGRASYQSAPCAPKQTATRSWETTPEAPPSNAELWRRYHAKQRPERPLARFKAVALALRPDNNASRHWMPWV